MKHVTPYEQYTPLHERNDVATAKLANADAEALASECVAGLNTYLTGVFEKGKQREETDGAFAGGDNSYITITTQYGDVRLRIERGHNEKIESDIWTEPPMIVLRHKMLGEEFTKLDGETDREAAKKSAMKIRKFIKDNRTEIVKTLIPAVIRYYDQMKSGAETRQINHNASVNVQADEVRKRLMNDPTFIKKTKTEIDPSGKQNFARMSKRALAAFDSKEVKAVFATLPTTDRLNKEFITYVAYLLRDIESGEYQLPATFQPFMDQFMEKFKNSVWAKDPDTRKRVFKRLYDLWDKLSGEASKQPGVST